VIFLLHVAYWGVEKVILEGALAEEVEGSFDSLAALLPL
jgi:hypothetical protein